MPSPVRFDAPRFPTDSSIIDPQRAAAMALVEQRDCGYADGYAAGLRAAESEVAEAIAEHQRATARLDEVAVALEAAVDDLARRDAVGLGELESAAIELAVALAEGLVGRELESTTAPVIDALRRAAALVPERGTPIVRVRPTDAETAREAIDAELMSWNGDAEIVPDPAIEPGGCIVEVGPCRIDAQLAPAIERMRDALT